MAEQQSEASYRELFLVNPQPMWVCHRESLRLLAVNEALLGLYGYRRQEFLELSLSRLLPEGVSLPEVVPDQAQIARHLSKDGAPLEVELVWHPCLFEGEPAYLVLVRDRSLWEGEREADWRQRLAAEHGRMEEALRELETFSYSISHDLQAPLRHINGFSQALLDDYGSVLDHQAREYLTRISQAAARMSKLIEAIQQLSRVARNELNRQQVNLSVAAQVISLELRHAAPERRVEFEIAEGVSADADPRLARQLLEILIGNAWKFSSKKESASIEFGVRQLAEETVYFVRDDGVGFDMAYAQKLFSIFHRLHRPEDFEGTGVGLAIAHRIVGRHGGRIWAESAPEKGATFYFTLGRGVHA